MLLDWGGTITTFHDVDMLDAWRLAARVLAPEREEEVAAALLSAEREVWSRTESTMRSATTAEVLRAASEAVGLPVDEALHDEALLAYLDGWTPTTVARAAARAALLAFHERGLRTGLLSNTHWPAERHEAWLRRDGLLDLLDARVYTSDLEHVKPHPQAFATVLDRVGVDPAAAVFVGDRLWDDVHGARQMGMRTVWMRNPVVPSYDVQPDAVVDTLAELVEVVERWCNAG